MRHRQAGGEKREYSNLRIHECEAGSCSDPLRASSVLTQKLQPVLQFFGRHKKLIFSINAILLACEHQFVIFAHDDRFFGTHFLAESAKNTSKHINLEFYRG